MSTAKVDRQDIGLLCLYAVSVGVATCVILDGEVSSVRVGIGVAAVGMAVLALIIPRV